MLQRVVEVYCSSSTASFAVAGKNVMLVAMGLNLYGPPYSETPAAGDVLVLLGSVVCRI